MGRCLASEVTCPACLRPVEVFSGSSPVRFVGVVRQSLQSPIVRSSAVFSDPTGRRRLVAKWVGAGVGLVLISYLALVGVGLAADGHAPLTPWLPSDGASGKGPEPHRVGRLAAKRARSTSGPQIVVRPAAQSKAAFVPARPTTRPHSTPSGSHSVAPPSFRPVTPSASTRPTGPGPTR